ncbi:MAG: ABC transporter permease [bacterium]|nr:ABC transporter permease [bacterium]
MLKSYFKIMLRNLYKNKLFSLINLAGLAVGMAAFLLIFLYVNSELSYDGFHKNADRIYRVRNDRIYKNIHDKSAGCPPGLGPALKKEFPEVIDSARLYNLGYMGANTIVSYPEGNQTFNQGKLFFADASFLKIFSFPMLKGSPQSALIQPNTAVIAQSTAKKYFGNENPMGKVISVTGSYGKQIYKITGVFKDVPENSHVKFEFLLSYKTLTGLRPMAKNYLTGWNAFNTYILLSPTADPTALEAKFPGLIAKHKSHGEDYKRAYLLQRVKDIHLYSNLRWEPEVNGNSKTVSFLALIAVFILIIAWVNYINLSTARSMTRAKEVGIRKVLGSRRSQLIKQFLLESVFLNIPAVLLAVGIAEISLPYFNGLTGKHLVLNLSLLGNYWIWAALFIAGGAFVSGIFPAFILSSFSPMTVLKGVFNRSVKGFNLRKVLVVFQFATAIFLIAVTAVVYQQLSFMRSRDLGVDIDRTLVVKAARINDAAGKRGNRGERFKNELKQYPAIKNITGSSTVPGQEYSNVASGIRPVNSNPEDGKRCFFIDVDYDYFDFFGITLLAGRAFSRDFGTDNKAVLLNEEALKMFGYEKPGEALKQKILLGGLGNQEREVIGVIKNYHHKSLKDSLQPVIFSLTGSGNFFSLKIGGGEIGGTISMVREKWGVVFPGQPFEYFFLDQSFDGQYKADRRFGNVFGLFAVLAIFISCLGLFGLASFTSQQRGREIGIRKVVGASVSAIVFLLSKEFGKWVLLANIAAWPLAYYFTGVWLRNFAYRVDVGLVPFIISGVIGLVIALITVSMQTIRAASANPVKSLRPASGS